MKYESIEEVEALLRLCCRDSADEDTAIRNLCRPYLTELECEGDSYGVPSISAVVELTIKKLLAKHNFTS